MALGLHIKCWRGSSEGGGKAGRHLLKPVQSQHHKWRKINQYVLHEVMERGTRGHVRDILA